eukprot:1158759-Pelagomonas_calceolata.AAC.7
MCGKDDKCTRGPSIIQEGNHDGRCHELAREGSQAANLHPIKAAHTHTHTHTLTLATTKLHLYLEPRASTRTRTHTHTHAHTHIYTCTYIHTWQRNPIPYKNKGDERRGVSQRVRQQKWTQVVAVEETHLHTEAMRVVRAGRGFFKKCGYLSEHPPRQWKKPTYMQRQ